MNEVKISSLQLYRMALNGGFRLDRRTWQGKELAERTRKLPGRVEQAVKGLNPGFSFVRYKDIDFFIHR